MRTIKILPLILAVVLITIVAKAQDVNTCRPKAEHILTAAQSHKPDGIDELLAPDFRFSNIKQPVAAKVLKQIITHSDLSNLEAVGIAVHGILGQSFYKDFDILFDFKGGEILLLRPDTTYQWLMNEGYHCQTVKGMKKGKTALILGNRTFKKLWTTFSDVSHFKESKGIDGLFGCEVLTHQKLLISYKHEELILID